MRIKRLTQELHQSGDSERRAHGITRAVQLEFAGIVLPAKRAMNMGEGNAGIRLGRAPVRSTLRSCIMFIIIVTPCEVWLRLGCSLPPLGKPLVSVWKREPGSEEKVTQRS